MAKSSAISTPLRFGLTGLGGYARYVCDQLLAQDQAPEPAGKLIAVSDPEMDRYPARVADLAARGIPVVTDFRKLLDFPIDAVWLPLPIDLHLPYTEMALAAGKPVMCEKPAAGCVDDVDQMISARDRTGLPVAIGFQDVYQPSVAVLKDRLVSGEFGAPRSVCILGCWPRNEQYFARNGWAGRLRRDGRWVMDSPASNAFAHFLHLALFLLGRSRHECARPTDVSAELYRANRIENYDTCSMRFTLDNDVPIYLAYTHACCDDVEPVVIIETDRARIQYIAGGEISISRPGGDESLPLSTNPHQHMIASFRSLVREGCDSVIGSTLEMARAHVVAVNAASECAPVIDVVPEYVDVVSCPDDTVLRSIRDVVPAMRSAVAKQCLLYESGVAPWAHRATTMPINGYTHFAGPAKSRASAKLEARTFTAAPPSGAVSHSV